MAKFGEMMRVKQALKRLEQGSEDEREEEEIGPAPGLRESALASSQEWIKVEEEKDKEEEK